MSLDQLQFRNVSVALDMVALSMMDVTIVTNPRMKAALVLR